MLGELEVSNGKQMFKNVGGNRFHVFPGRHFEVLRHFVNTDH